MSNATRVRFAPSPTGYLHLGSARTALYNWLFARQRGGVFVLRIEDTDRERSTEEKSRAIIEGLRWMGLDWDEGPFFQSERLDIYAEAAKRLWEARKIYPCTCTPDVLEAKRERALAEGRKPMYDGTCRGRTELPSGEPYVFRLRTPDSGATVVSDLIKGEVVFDNSELDDFIIVRSDGTPTYNFAVVVDDADMRITHVIRGDDHLSNTPKQILVYEALGLEPPQFAHQPLILGPDRSKLSKRHGATAIEAYRDMGILPEAMMNFLVRLGWSYGDQEVFTPRELLEKFSIEGLGKSAAVFNFEKLLWLNMQHMKLKTDDELAGLVRPFLERRGYAPPSDEWLRVLVQAYKERMRTLGEVAEHVAFAFEEPEYDPKAVGKFLKPEAAELLDELADRLEKLDPYDLDSIRDVFQGMLSAHELKMKKLAQPVRVALTGSHISPPIHETIALVPRERAVERLRRAADMARSNEQGG